MDGTGEFIRQQGHHQTLTGQTAQAGEGHALKGEIEMSLHAAAVCVSRMTSGLVAKLESRGRKRGLELFRDRPRDSSHSAPLKLSLSILEL